MASESQTALPKPEDIKLDKESQDKLTLARGLLKLLYQKSAPESTSETDLAWRKLLAMPELPKYAPQTVFHSKGKQPNLAKGEGMQIDTGINQLKAKDWPEAAAWEAFAPVLEAHSKKIIRPYWEEPYQIVVGRTILRGPRLGEATGKAVLAAAEAVSKHMPKDEPSVTR